MYKISRFGLVLYGACAVIWSVRAILEIAYQTYHDSVFWFVMNLLCAPLWIAAFLVNWKRFRAQQEENKR